MLNWSRRYFRVLAHKERPTRISNLAFALVAKIATAQNWCSNPRPWGWQSNTFPFMRTIAINGLVVKFKRFKRISTHYITFLMQGPPTLPPPFHQEHISQTDDGSLLKGHTCSYIVSCIYSLLYFCSSDRINKTGNHSEQIFWYVPNCSWHSLLTQKIGRIALLIMCLTYRRKVVGLNPGNDNIPGFSFSAVYTLYCFYLI